nr:MAG TPA: hypothetical protein [Caudoviricetes sp.]
MSTLSKVINESGKLTLFLLTIISQLLISYYI